MRYADANCTIVSTGSHYIVTGRDVFTGNNVEIKIPSEELFAYRQGAYIQDAMPSLSAAEREFLISGMYEWPFEEGVDE